jgi:hypothetical protein
MIYRDLQIDPFLSQTIPQVTTISVQEVRYLIIRPHKQVVRSEHAIKHGKTAFTLNPFALIKGQEIQHCSGVFQNGVHDKGEAVKECPCGSL